ncbi:hypothetical protein DF046_26200 [Burkholderia cepacia]|nr:hypothetical protein DF046_26200 [Burkholderia cepacia]
MFEDKRFEYDVYGRLVRKLSGHGPAKELALEYDDWNQLKTVVTKDRLGIATTHFEYDAFGRRIRKLNGSYASTDFLCDGMRLVQETYHDRQGEEALTYLYEANSYVPLARIDQGKQAANDADARDAVYYFHNDVSGLPEELTDAGGDLVWQARYKVWGNAGAGGVGCAGAAAADSRLGRSVGGRANANTRTATTEPAFPGAVSGPRDRVALQHFPVLRSRHRAIHQSRPDRPERWE